MPVYGHSDMCWTAIAWISMFIGLHCLLVGGIDYWQGAIVKFRRTGMDGSVTEAQDHDEGRSGRSVTGVHEGVRRYRTKV